MRASVPAMFALAVLVGRAPIAAPRKSAIRGAMLLVLGFGLVAPISEATRALTDTHAGRNVVENSFDRHDLDASQGIGKVATSLYLLAPRFLAQHVALADTLFGRHIARN